MDKKILCFISNTNLFGFGMKGVNQQETLSSKLDPLGSLVPPSPRSCEEERVLEKITVVGSNINEKDKGSSETTRDITYNFDEYSNLIPKHKNKINKKFLE